MRNLGFQHTRRSASRRESGRAHTDGDPFLLSILPTCVFVPPPARQAPPRWIATRDITFARDTLASFAWRHASRSSVMLYRSKTLRVLWPLIFIATVSGTPARTMLRNVVLRKSWTS